MISPALPVPGPYRPLHAYLDGRFADSVVLTFGEIEDLIGFALPDLARVQPEWWANDGTRGTECRAWTQASRTAKPNLFARTVLFERGSI
jgi:hypothetical protein